MVCHALCTDINTQTLALKTMGHNDMHSQLQEALIKCETTESIANLDIFYVDCVWKYAFANFFSATERSQKMNTIQYSNRGFLIQTMVMIR